MSKFYFCQSKSNVFVTHMFCDENFNARSLNGLPRIEIQINKIYAIKQLNTYFWLVTEYNEKSEKLEYYEVLPLAFLVKKSDSTYALCTKMRIIKKLS